MNLRPILLGLATAGAIVGATRTPSAQRPDPAAIRARMLDRRPLDAAEIDQVLALARTLVGGQPFHFTAERGDFAADILFERDGHVRFIRTRTNASVHFTEYTGRIARYCDRTIADGELVIEYQQAGAGWTVNARVSSLADVLRPVFDMLVGLKPLMDEGIARDGTRALSAGWNLQPADTPRSRTSGGGGSGAGGSTFALADPTVSGVERLVIDPMSLRPLRWEFAVSPSNGLASSATTTSYRFDYDNELVLAPPTTGVSAPDCVDLQNRFVPAVR